MECLWKGTWQERDCTAGACPVHGKRPRKPARDIRAGDRIVWAGAPEAGAEAVTGWDGEGMGFRIRWTYGGAVHEEFLTWTPDGTVNLA